MSTYKSLSEIKIRDDRKATLQLLVNKVKQRKEDFPAPPFFLLLGAGCSFDARIPTGSGVMAYLQKRCFAESHLTITDHSLLHLDKIDSLLKDKDLQTKLTSFVDEKQTACQAQVDEKKDELLASIPPDLAEVLKKNNPGVGLWEVVKDEFYQASYYGFWFDITLPDPRERQRLIEEIIDRKEPSAAYILLACVVNSDGIRTIFTTNFDDLVNDAILQETDKKSRIYAHNELVKFINFRSPRPNIVKLHGDYLFQDMKNTLNETATLQDDQIIKLQEAAQDMGIIVTGYSGADRSIMDALYAVKEKRGASFPLYWCARDESTINWRAKHLINTYPNSYYVPVDTFEQLVIKLFNDLGCTLRDVEEKKQWVEKHHQKAVDILNRPDLKKQSPTLEKALRVDEILAQARQKKDLSERVDFLNDIINKVQPDAALYTANGYYKNELKRYEDSLIDLDKAIGLDPTHAIAYNNRGSVKNSLKRYEEALIDLDKAIDLDPTVARTYTNRGSAKNGLKRYEEALLDFDKAIDLDPTHATAYNNRGFAKNNLRRYEEALLDLNKAIDLDPSETVRYNNRGISKQGLERYEEAIMDFDRAIDINPTWTYPYIQRGKAFRKMNRLDEAIASVSKAIQLDSDYANAYANLAEIKAAQGDTEGFYTALETALQNGCDTTDRFTDEVYIPYLADPRFTTLVEQYIGKTS